MEATLLTSSHFTPQLLSTTPFKIGGGHMICDHRFYRPLRVNTCASLKMSVLESSQTRVLSKRPLLSRTNRKVSVHASDQLQSDYMNVEPTSESINPEVVSPRLDDGANTLSSHNVNNYESLQLKPKMFKNRFLNFVRLSSVLNNAAESFFKSEIRRRLFVTAVLIILSRVGYFIPLPGFDRRLIPQDYLSFAAGSVDDLGDFTAELKLSFFQLGISPQIIASIIMQVLCHVVPSLVKLRKEGLDGHETIKRYMCV